jgi:hypothetical protein
MTTRRGFLGFLAAAGIAAVAGPVVEAAPAPAPAPLPKPGQSYEAYTFKRAPGWFDLVTYTGIGSSITLPNSLGDAIGCVIIKCRTKPTDWFVLETDGADITLPERFNEAGHEYIAYQFGKEAMPQIQPYIDMMKEMRA